MTSNNAHDVKSPSWPVGQLASCNASTRSHSRRLLDASVSPSLRAWPCVIRRYATCSRLPVAVFSLVLDCENRDGIPRGFEAVQGKVASGTKVDHKLTKIIMVFHRPANHVRLFERHKRLADCKHSPLRSV
jgi:hypothetical protein